MRKISVIIKEPGKVPRHTHISATTENMEKIVGGEADEIQIASNIIIIFNHRQRGLPRCCEISNLNLNGTVVFCGERKTGANSYVRDDFPLSFEAFKVMFSKMWEKPRITGEGE